MLVRLHSPYFERGVLRFPAGDCVELPDEIATVEVAKGLAKFVDKADEPTPPAVAAKAKGKKGA